MSQFLNNTGAKKIAVVVLNYNNHEDSISCIDSLLQSEIAPCVVSLVDNASSDDSVAKLHDWLLSAAERAFEAEERRTPSRGETCRYPLPQTDVLLSVARRNQGYAAGNNIGMAAAFAEGADAAWILNNDVIVEPSALGAMRDKIFSRGDYGICGSVVLYHDAPDMVQCLAGGKTNRLTALSTLQGNNMSREEAACVAEEDVEKAIGFIYGASVMVTRDFYETVGAMDEGYFLYCEEQDWAARIQGRFRLGFASRAVVRHKEGATTGWSHCRFSVRSLWRITRSRLRLTRKHTPWALPTVCCGIAFAALRMGMRWVARK